MTAVSLADINECANETVCGLHAFCQNLIGTYQCLCDQGYESTGDGQMCVGELSVCRTLVKNKCTLAYLYKEHLLGK